MDPDGQSNKQEIREEEIRMIRLRLRVDLTSYRLLHMEMSREAGLELIEQTRREILTLFPGKEDVFDLVLRPRFLRILNERAMSDWGVLDSLN
jgi:hypothetical protein